MFVLEHDTQAARVSDGLYRRGDTKRRIVIVGVVTVRPAVDRLMPALPEVFDNGLLEFVSAVI